MYIISKWKLRDVISTVTLLPYAFHQGSLGGTHYCSKGAWKGPPNLIRGYQIGGEAQHSTTGYSYPVTLMVNMMSNDNRCFVCGKKGYNGCHCPSVQCYNCDDFGHFAQDFPEKIPSSGTPHHHDRSHFHSCHDCNHRKRYQSFHHRCNQGKCFDRSGSHHQPQCDRSSSNCHRNTSLCLSCHCSSMWYSSIDRYSRRHCHRETQHCHNQNSSIIQQYSMDHGQSSSRHSSDTTHRSHAKKTLKPHSQTATPIDTNIRRRSLFKTWSQTLPQNWMMIQML